MTRWRVCRCSSAACSRRSSSLQSLRAEFNWRPALVPGPRRTMLARARPTLECAANVIHLPCSRAGARSSSAGRRLVGRARRARPSAPWAPSGRPRGHSLAGALLNNSIGLGAKMDRARAGRARANQFDWRRAPVTFHKLCKQVFLYLSLARSPPNCAAH